MPRWILGLLISAVIVTNTFGQEPRGETRDIIYATVNGKDLRLDLYMPRNVASPFLVVWVHGGAWSRGSKADAPLGFVSSGFALASLDFRLSTEAPFPAQIQDIK